MTVAPNVVQAVCPVHGQPMRAFESSWKCTKKMADGTWCTQRVPFPKPPPPKEEQIVAPGASSVLPSQSFSDVALRLKALEFAQKFSADPGDALQLARDAFAFLKEQT